MSDLSLNKLVYNLDLVGTSTNVFGRMSVIAISRIWNDIWIKNVFESVGKMCNCALINKINVFLKAFHFSPEIFGVLSRNLSCPLFIQMEQQMDKL